MTATSARYPEHPTRFPPQLAEKDIPAKWQRFLDLRDDLLLGHGYNIAQACWANLRDRFERAVGRDKDVLALTEAEQNQCYAPLRRGKYSELTIRQRRVTSQRLSAMEFGSAFSVPATSLAIRSEA